jgi:hypothetical protein
MKTVKPLRWRKESMKQELTGYLRIDLYRAFVSVIFPLAVAGMAAILYASVRYVIVESTAEHHLDVATLHMMARTQGFNDIFYVLGALPFAASFCLDWNHQFLKPLLIRANMTLYAISKIIVCALSAFVTIVSGQVLFLLILSLNYPLVDANNVMLESLITGFTHGELLAQGHNVLYFMHHIIGMSVGAAFFALLAFLVSTRIQNTFVVLASPIILFMTFRLLTDMFFAKLLPVWLIPSVVLIGRWEWGTPLLSLLYEIFMFALVSVPLGLLIIRQLKRRLANG